MNERLTNETFEVLQIEIEALRRTRTPGNLMARAYCVAHSGETHA
ncbi:hypothetical protein [Dyella subtropica]|nr:hypothetical protein [Dyella subtropica]